VRGLLKLIVFIVVLLAACVGGALFYSSHIAKLGIERGAEYALGVTTTVDSVGIRLLRGEIRVRELRIANPTGFTEPYFLEIGSFTFHTPPRNVLEDTVEVQLVAFDALAIDIERKKKSSNYGTILSNLDKFESSDPQASSTSGDQGASKQFVVRELTITNVTAKLRQEVLAGQDAAVTVTIPEIRLRDVGTESGGVTMGELTGIVTKAVLDAVTKSAGVPAAILGDLAGSLKGLADVRIELPGGIGDATGAAGTLGAELGGKAGKQADKLLKGLGGLLGGSGKKENTTR